MRLLFSGLFAGALFGCTNTPDSKGGTDLLLTEERTWSPDNPETLAGASLLQGGRIAAWWHGGRVVVKSPTGDSMIFLQPTGSTIATVIPGRQGDLLIVDRGLRHVREYSLAGRVLTETQLSLGTSESAVDVAWLGSRLLVGIADSIYGAFRVVPADDFDKVLFAARFAPGDGGMVPFHLTAFGNGVLVTEVAAPFAVSVILVDGSVRPFATPARGVIHSDDPQPEPADWVSLPVVGLADGVLQELTLLSGDSRKLLRYNSTGGVAKVTDLDVPLGILDSDPTSRLVLGARRVLGLELVVYRWTRGENGSRRQDHP